MKTITNCDRTRFTEKLLQRALTCLETQQPIKIKRYHHGKVKAEQFYKIEVGKRYRLISTDCEQWELTSHEFYNRYFL